MFRKNSGIEKFQAKEGGSSTFCRQFYYLKGPKIVNDGTILCFRKILVENILWVRGRRGYHDFPSNFLSQCTKIFHWRTLWCVRKILSCIGGGGITVLSKLFVPHDRNEKFCKRNLLFSGNFLTSRNLWKEGVYQDFNQNFYVWQCRKRS